MLHNLPTFQLVSIITTLWKQCDVSVLCSKMSTACSERQVGLTMVQVFYVSNIITTNLKTTFNYFINSRIVHMKFLNAFTEVMMYFLKRQTEITPTSNSKLSMVELGSIAVAFIFCRTTTYYL